MLILIILASLIPGILAVTQYIKNNESEAVLYSKIDGLKTDNGILNNQLKSVIEDNAKLSHQLTETAIVLNNNVLGSSDIDIQINNTKNTEFNFRFENKSDLPIINAQITIQNYNQIKKCPIIKETDNQIHIKYACYEQSFLKHAKIDINPHGAIVFNDKNFYFFKDYMNFAIQIETRRKTVIYHLVYKLINSEMVKSYRIYELIDGKKIYISEVNPLGLDPEYWNNNFYEKILFTN